jgi:choice-of-anchor B domain-containing protein
MKTGAVSTLLLVLAAVPLHGQTLAGGSVPAANAGFGGALEVVDGDILVGEGANQTRPGLVYVYRKGASGWAEAAKLQAPAAFPSDGFGSALSLDGQTLLVGATRQNEGSGAAFLFTRSANGTWTQTAELRAANAAEGDNFGGGVTLSGDVALVGAPNRNEGAGAVYVFRRSGANWVQEAELTATGAAQGEAFGVSLAVDGDVALIGAPGRNERAGVVLAFTRNAAGQWTQSEQIAANGLQPNDQFGGRIVLEDGLAYVSAPTAAGGAGSVFAFRRTDEGQWRPAARFFPFAVTGQGAAFGLGLALDGTQLWIGAPAGAGAVYAFTRGAENDWADADRMTAENIRGGMGSAVAVQGNLAAAGAASADGGAGAVAVFERTGEQWSQAAVLISPEDRIASITGDMVRCGDDGQASGFDCQNVELVSFLSVSDLGGGRGIRMNDVWGWTDPDTDREYVIAGRIDGTSFVDITDPENPRYLGNLPRTEGTRTSSWRDMKVYENHVFIVADGAPGHGMQVFDLTRLRDVPNAPVEFTADVLYDQISSVHNIVINPETGFAFAVGARDGGETCGGGLHIIDVRQPKTPTFAGCFADPQTGRAGTGYSHDAQCFNYTGPDADYRGREICLGSNETMLSISDVTDKQSPKAIARASYPNVGYSHQGWFDEEQKFFYMNDELDELQGLVPRTRTIIWDLTDLDDPQVVAEHLGTQEASDHNLYIVGNTMYQSNYQSGLRVLDITDRQNPREVGYFDTVPFGENSAGFGGSWSNFPFFSSGNIAVTSGSEGLFILRKRDTRPVS